jgi:hypothetical protein
MKTNYLNKNVGCRVPEYKLAYIRNNCESKTADELAGVLRISKTTIYLYCLKMNLPLKKKRVHEPEDTTEIAKKRGVIRLFKQDPEKKPISRPPAKYGNMSSEDKINYYLSL